MKARHLAIALTMVLPGCMVGPDYQRPEIDSPEGYQQQTEPGESIANLEWWDLYADERMRELISTALENNKDLAIAVARIEEARARYGFVRADLYPKVDAQLGATRGDNIGQLIPGANIGITENYVLAGGVAWEIDLFGKLRRSSEAARAELLATEEARRSVMITLIADVGSAYLLLVDLDNRYEIAKRTLDARRESTKIIRARFDKGVVPLLDVNQAEIQEGDAAAEMYSLERDRAQVQNQLNVLLGSNPAPILRGNSTAMNLRAPIVPAGLPSELLERRPDVRQAEQQLAAQTARIGVAQALRLPSLSLTGTLGVASGDLSDLLEGDSKVWDITGNLFAPLFAAGQNARRVEVERALTEQLLYQYEQTVLRAFQEVEDALAEIRTAHAEALARKAQVEAARSASTLSRARYDGGVTSYLEVLEVERSLFRAELAESA
ncbi:MAG: efflux transporter outer membrane subunit, partial [Gammaproteobacteria bacterium]